MINRSESLAFLFGDHPNTHSSTSQAPEGGVVIAGSGHMVQFYEDEAFLHSTLREFVGIGLHAGHACVVIGRKEHINALEGQLVDAITQSVHGNRGYYRAMNAHEALNRFMIGGKPDWERFQTYVGGILDEAARHATPVRVFGEMVDMLWEEGNRAAALQLEKFWNKLAFTRPFFLYCAYPVSRFNTEVDRTSLQDISCSHTHILSGENGNSSRDQQALIARLYEEIESLHLSEMRYRRLFETAIDGILLIDASTYTIIDANPGAAQLLGCDKSTLVGTNIFSIEPFTRNHAMQAEFEKLPANQHMRYETHLETADGIHNEIEIIATPYSEGLTPIIQLSLRDITERKKAEQLEMRTSGLLAEREHLMELNVAKDEFISLASHQLRTPATGVKQYVGMLLQGYMGEITDIQRIGLEKAYESNERQLKIVNDLLLVARVDAGKVVLTKQPCDLVQLIRDVASEQEEEIRAREQHIELKLPRSLTVIADARFLRMVLENLVTNASKYSDDGLSITISVRRRGTTAIISVKDRGVGISKEDMPKLYQKFSRIYNDRSTVVDGTGLGLYWSKKIIELHSGDLAVSSKLNHGSTFTITLPIT